MQLQHEIVIIGGGLAGLTAALHLQQLDFNVTLIEKNAYPHHKVCGEYISNEVLPYLAWLGISFEGLGPSAITDLQFTGMNGRMINTKLPLGGFGLSRYAMDHYLYQQLLLRNINVVHDTVTDVVFNNDQFTITTNAGKVFNADHCLGAFGKRSTLDVKLKRSFIHQKSPYVAVKAHYRGAFDPHVVGLHNFAGGYCGVSMVEDQKINICYLADYQSFKQHKSITDYQEKVICKNSCLKAIFANAEPLFEAPITIGQIYFNRKEAVVNHMLMIGDTAGLIHPLCGNGMAMAIHSAKIAAELIAASVRDKHFVRADLEKTYTKLWNENFASRMQTGKLLSSVLRNKLLQNVAVNTLTKLPKLLNNMIKLTHGKPITMPSR